MDLLKDIQKYQEHSISNRFFKHTEVQILLNNLNSEKFILTQIGHSAEGRAIHLVKYGKGATRIFLWSQMHGDEATATMALFDLFNFLEADDEQGELRNSISNNCTLYILPMVNPDGAEYFTRRNAQGIDINRDFNKRQSPEAIILAETRDQINPHFGFNLHDQSTIWSAGKSGNPATISVLAPAFDAELTVNDTRLKAMNVITLINEELQKIIPGHVGRFNDEYEPRAFGDNFQALGTSTILIEAGGYADDSEKQFIRKIFFKAILKGLEVIAANNNFNNITSSYFSIPENEKLHFQTLIKNCLLTQSNIHYTADIGLIAIEEIAEDLKSVTYTYVVEDMGDLEGFNGYEMMDASGLQITLIKPLICGQNADFVIRDGMTTILCIENGRITDKNF
ncbi:M14 family metallopeptidase [Daejeonella oryzae]|uniref:M14 family metallopeptidase n=1 Tax=Daejeonella oryzae TaxID=1122943 RepID=UPI0003F91BE2|nr:M14 metallopeptidase family protein [Daejeonella oryzae]